MLSDLPTDLHLLILEHDEEKKRLKEENQRQLKEIHADQCRILELQERVIELMKMLIEERGGEIPLENNA